MTTFDVEVIDTHCHAEPWFMGRAHAKPDPAWFKDLFAECRHRTRLAVSGTGANELFEKVGNVGAMKTLAGLLAPWPDKFVPSVMVDPNNLDDALEAVELAVTRYKFRCVGELVQYIHDWRTDGRLILPVVQLAIRLDVPLMIHAGGEEHAEGVERLAEKFPRARIIIAHSAGGRAWRRGVQCIRRFPNVLVEIMQGNREQLSVLLEAVGPRRITYGTDFGVHQDPALRYTAGNWLLDMLAEMKLSDADIERIAGGNAREAMRL